jgi:hypothetical protein
VPSGSQSRLWWIIFLALMYSMERAGFIAVS